MPRLNSALSPSLLALFPFPKLNESWKVEDIYNHKKNLSDAYIYTVDRYIYMDIHMYINKYCINMYICLTVCVIYCLHLSVATYLVIPARQRRVR
jgi:hypothetical protein